jgi:hypothetical protein
MLLALTPFSILSATHSHLHPLLNVCSSLPLPPTHVYRNLRQYCEHIGASLDIWAEALAVMNVP